MGRSIEEIKRIYSENSLNAQKLEGEISDLLKKERETNAEATTAAEAGNVDAYMQKSSILDRIKATIHVKRIQADKMTKSPVSEGEAAAAWSDYMRKYEREFERLEKASIDACTAASSAYINLCELQNKALIDREQIAAMLKVDPETIMPIRKTIQHTDSNTVSVNRHSMPIMAALCVKMAQKNEQYFETIVDNMKPYTEE